VRPACLILHISRLQCWPKASHVGSTLRSRTSCTMFVCPFIVCLFIERSITGLTPRLRIMYWWQALPIPLCLCTCPICLGRVTLLTSFPLSCPKARSGSYTTLYPIVSTFATQLQKSGNGGWQNKFNPLQSTRHLQHTGIWPYRRGWRLGCMPPTCRPSLDPRSLAKQVPTKNPLKLR
jgi:hypothetical protein